MNKYFVVFLVVVLAVIGVVYLRGAPVAVAPSPTPTVSMTPTASPTPTPKSTPKVSTKPTPGIIVREVQVHRVNIQNLAYSSTTVTVARGDVVAFKNRDSVLHTVTADAGAFDSGIIDPNDEWQLVTDKLTPGTYTFHCAFHPTMRGTLIVQ